MVLLSQQAPWYSSPRSPVQRHKDTVRVTAAHETRRATSRRSPGCRDRVFRDGSAKYNAQPQGLRPPWVTITCADVCTTDHVCNYPVTTKVPQRRAPSPPGALAELTHSPDAIVHRPMASSSSSKAPSASDNAAAWSAYADELTRARAEIERLRAENASLRSQVYDLQMRHPPPGAPHVSPPMFYPPAAQPMPYAYGALPPYGGYAPPMHPSAAQHEKPPIHKAHNPPLAINAENKRGPKGANLALFCIPNSYTDQQVYDLAAPHGNVLFAQVSTHRDTGLSRGYAFVSYETIEEANVAMSALHNLAIEGRALRCEVARSDREQGGSRPY